MAEARGLPSPNPPISVIALQLGFDLDGASEPESAPPFAPPVVLVIQERALRAWVRCPACGVARPASVDGPSWHGKHSSRRRKSSKYSST